MKHKKFWVVMGSLAVVSAAGFFAVKKGWFKKKTSSDTAIPDGLIYDLIASAKQADSSAYRSMTIEQARSAISPTATAADVTELINALNRLTQYGSDENNAPEDVITGIDAALEKLKA